MYYAMQRIGEYLQTDVASALKMRDYKDATDLIGGGTEMKVVRRLTPLECTRLQGYADGWVDLPHKESMSDEELAEWNKIRQTKAEMDGKTYKPCGKESMLTWYNSMVDADSNKYKALGNSIALPYWKVLARRISAQYDRDITMASLFSGIGGFEESFRHCGSVPIWASEVEPYSIAVTKVRFPE